MMTMTQQKKLLARFNCCLMVANKQVTHLCHSHINDVVLELQICFPPEVGKYLTRSLRYDPRVAHGLLPTSAI